MDYHGITSIGKIYVQRVSTLPIWSLTDIARILYTNDTYKFHLGGNTSWREIVDCVTTQTITGVKTFAEPPLLLKDPDAGDEAVRLSYLEANYTKGAIDLSAYVTLAGTQAITGLKTFNTVLPQSTIAPLENEDFANKAYVDSVAPKVAVSESDSTINYLWNKLQGGDGISISKMGADGYEQTIRISVAALAGGNFYSDLPIGTIIKFAGSSAPAGYLECDGAAISRSTYSDLFNVIGEDYGGGNHTTTFNVPTCSGDACGGEMWCIKYSESEAANGVDEMVKCSSDDTTSGYLEQKLQAGAGISIVTNQAGANEYMTISSAAGASGGGMWLKSSGGNACKVKAGSVVINNVIYSINLDKDLSLSGYIREGENTNAAGVLYLYAVGGSGSVPDFKFSYVQPTINKYGNAVSFAEEAGRSELYHPNQGTTWRYIGELYNQGSSNALAFDKMYPGYFESNWRQNPFAYQKDSNPGTWYIPVSNPDTGAYDSQPFYFGLGLLPTKWKGFYSPDGNEYAGTVYDINWVCGVMTSVYTPDQWVGSGEGGYTVTPGYYTYTYFMGSFAIWVSNWCTMSIMPTIAKGPTSNAFMYVYNYYNWTNTLGYFKFILEK